MGKLKQQNAIKWNRFSTWKIVQKRMFMISCTKGLCLRQESCCHVCQLLYLYMNKRKKKMQSETSFLMENQMAFLFFQVSSCQQRNVVLENMAGVTKAWYLFHTTLSSHSILQFNYDMFSSFYDTSKFIPVQDNPSFPFVITVSVTGTFRSQIYFLDVGRRVILSKPQDVIFYVLTKNHNPSTSCRK